MSRIGVRGRIGFCAALAAAGVIAGAAPATAGPAANPAGVASLGSASFVKDGVASSVPPLAPCAVDGRTTNSTGLVTASGVRFGGGSSTCTTTVVDPENAITTTKSEALGERFELSALVSAGGPRVRFSTYRVTCTATDEGTSASWAYSGLTGITGLPNPMPANHVHEIANSADVVLATATFNEVTLPDPNDGSIALAMLRVRFLPASGVQGEVVVGATACSPTP